MNSVNLNAGARKSTGFSAPGRFPGPDRGRRRRLLAEFLALYALAPLAMAVLLPPLWMFPALLAVMAVALVLLHLTPGFRWGELLAGLGALRRARGWGLVLAFAAVTALVSWGILRAAHPDALFALPRERPGLMAVIFLLYPWLSALPQEIIFRVLFFRRYGGLMPGPGPALVINAAVFSLAHLMYWSWVVLVLTFAGGLVFAWAFVIGRSFPLAFLLHVVAGWILFAFGMGVYFYAGNVVRPF